LLHGNSSDNEDDNEDYNKDNNENDGTTTRMTTARTTGNSKQQGTTTTMRDNDDGTMTRTTGRGR
jgi:hypothetical protein